VPAVHFVDGTIDYEGPEAVTAKGDTLRIVVVPTPDAAPCVVDVALAKPFKVTAKHCLDGAKLLSLVLSPRAAWVAWQANANATADVTWVRTMNLDSGEIGVDVATNPSDDILVTDTGRLVIDMHVARRPHAGVRAQRLCDDGRAVATPAAGASRACAADSLPPWV